MLDLEYRSERAMCSLAEGLTLGAARWYGISGDGNTFLGATPGDDDNGTRGISIGLR